MTVTVKNKWLFLALLIAFAGIFLLGRYLGKVKGEKQSVALVNNLNGIIKNYTYQLDSIRKYASEKDQIILTKDQALATNLLEKKELRALHLRTVNEVTQLKAQISILQDSLSHTGTIILVEPCDSVGLAYPVIKLPFVFTEKNDSYNLSGGFSETGIMNIDLKVPVKLDLYTGLDKKTKAYKAVVTSDNPVIQITGFNSMKFDLPKPRKFGLGLNLGYGILLSKDKVTTNPYVGLGVSYNFIRF